MSGDHNQHQKPVAYGWVEDGELKALAFADVDFSPLFSPNARKSGLYAEPLPSYEDEALLRECRDTLCEINLCNVNSMSSRHEMVRLADDMIGKLTIRLGDST